jgi:di/tricarboxylate transporter
MLSLQECILIGIVLGALVLIISNRLRPDIVAVLVLLSLSISEIVTPQEALSGFSRSAVITIIGLFVITEALDSTGVVQWIALRIRQIGGGSEGRLVVIIMATGAAMSLVMNNIAAGAVLLPAAVQIARESNVRPSKLLIPLGFGTLVGGMATYFTTANIILSGILQENNQEGLGMLDFLPTGGLVVLVTLLYMATIGRRLLPERESPGSNFTASGMSRNLREMYQLDERLWEVRVPPACELVNTSLTKTSIGEELGVTVMAIWRDHHAILAPAPTEVIRANDYLLVLGREERVRKLSEWGASVGRSNGKNNTMHDYSVDLTEVVIPPRSGASGKTLKDLQFRNKYGLTAVALWREGRSYRTDVGLQQLQVGDAMLMVGPAASIRRLASDRDFLTLEGSHAYQPPAPHKAKWALLITALVLLASILEVIPIAEAMLLGAVAVVIAGCLSMDEAYRAVEWRVVFLIAGMLPISIAMTNTGLADKVGSALVATLSPYGEMAMVGGVFLLTMAITQVLGGQVTALIVGPVAVPAALQMGMDASAIAVTVAIACSAAFLLPLGHPVNILMMGPGGYTFGDFFKVGIGMTVLTLIMVLVGMALFFGVG